MYGQSLVVDQHNEKFPKKILHETNCSDVCDYFFTIFFYKKILSTNLCIFPLMLGNHKGLPYKKTIPNIRNGFL